MALRFARHAAVAEIALARAVDEACSSAVADDPEVTWAQQFAGKPSEAGFACTLCSRNAGSTKRARGGGSAGAFAFAGRTGESRVAKALAVSELTVATNTGAAADALADVRTRLVTICTPEARAEVTNSSRLRAVTATVELVANASSNARAVTGTEQIIRSDVTLNGAAEAAEASLALVASCAIPESASGVVVADTTVVRTCALVVAWRRKSAGADLIADDTGVAAGTVTRTIT